MGRVAAIVGSTVYLRRKAIPVLGQQYGRLEVDTPWTVTLIDSGYGRDALWLQSREGQQILAWRGQVSPLPRCEYCGLEGHSSSSGTAKTCSVRAAEVAANRAALSAKMKAQWAERKGFPAPESSPAPQGRVIEVAEAVAEEAPF